MTDENEKLESELTSGEDATDEQVPDQAAGEEEATDTPPEGEDNGEEQQEQEGEGEQQADEAAAEPEQAKLDQNAVEVKRWRDEATQTRGHLATTLRTLKALKDAGAIDDAALDEAAQKAGLDPQQVRSVLNQEPPPVNALQANASRLVQQYGSADKPGELKLALDEAYGEDTQKFFDAYDWLIVNDPAEKEALAAVDPRKVASYAIRRGKEVYAEFQELKGGSLIDALRVAKGGKPGTTATAAREEAKPAKPAGQSKQQRVPLNGSSPAPKTEFVGQRGGFYEGL